LKRNWGVSSLSSNASKKSVSKKWNEPACPALRKTLSKPPQRTQIKRRAWIGWPKLSRARLAEVRENFPAMSSSVAAEHRLAQGAESGVQRVLQGLFHGGELAGFLPALDLEVAIRRECVWLTQSRPFYRPCESTEFQDDPDPQPAFYAL
jgi:hypothetical protein